MKKSCFVLFFVFPFAVVVFCIQSCCNSRPASSNKKELAHVPNQKLPGTPSLSPKMFRVDAVLSANPGIDSVNQNKIYILLIRDVLERGASLSSPVSGGETIETDAPLLSTFVQSALEKGDEVIALIEERLKMNSDRPAFVLRDLRKK